VKLLESLLKQVTDGDTLQLRRAIGEHPSF